jgi:hypothetical protein
MKTNSVNPSSRPIPSDAPIAPVVFPPSRGVATGAGEPPSNEGLPVTPLASTPLDHFRFLISGIDTLDLGLYVAWGADWKRRLRTLDQKKQQARKSGGILIKLSSGRTCIFKPGGKGENYRFHLQFEAYNVFIGKAARPGGAPNVYLSIAAATLWLHGIETAMAWIAEDIKAIGGGSIQSVKVSRLDLCADFHIPGGLSHEFLFAHKVTHNDSEKLYRGKNALETYYVGDSSSPIQGRLYNKGLEVQKMGTKLWFLGLWDLDTPADVWRCEFQIRRPALKEFCVDSLDDLKEKQGGIWAYLTGKWFSLRLPDNDKAERRTIHPFWSAVQSCALQLGPACEIKRSYGSSGNASMEWYLSHLDGCLSSFAALLGITCRDDALHELGTLLQRRNNATEFECACTKKAIIRGTLALGGAE